MLEKLKPYILAFMCYSPLLILCGDLFYPLDSGSRDTPSVVLRELLPVFLCCSYVMHALVSEQKQLTARIAKLEALTLENGSAQDQGQSN